MFKRDQPPPPPRPPVPTGVRLVLVRHVELEPAEAQLLELMQAGYIVGDLAPSGSSGTLVFMVRWGDPGELEA